MEIIRIQNLKCGGCQNSIRNGLEEIEGVKVLNINEEDSSVELEFTNDELRSKITEKLKKMGYPIEGDENQFLDKAKSYVSCMIGRVSD